MTVDYNTLAKTSILQAALEVDGKRQELCFNKYQLDAVVSFGSNNVSMYSVAGRTCIQETIPFVTFQYGDIKEVRLSICCRNFEKIGLSLLNEFHIDMIIILNNSLSYQLEIQSWNLFDVLYESLKKQNVKIIDPLEIYQSWCGDMFDEINHDLGINEIVTNNALLRENNIR